MDNIDLTQYSLEELIAHRKEVDKAIDAIRDAEIKKFREETEAKARALGVPLEEIFTAAVKTTRQTGVKGKPMYRHPTEPEKTWTGKGKPPNWIKEHEALGKSRDELLIR